MSLSWRVLLSRLTFDGHNGANLFWVEFLTQLHSLIDVFESILSRNIAYLVKSPLYNRPWAHSKNTRIGAIQQLRNAQICHFWPRPPLVTHRNKSSTTHPSCYVIFQILRPPINVSVIYSCFKVNITYNKCNK